ncbi:MAG: rod shape-determining protein MreC [Candidatus Omnitrophota bacterium]|nr:MAG: rod shape-determining protein MreC [Candidatus Omnitrophota bacterium]
MKKIFILILVYGGFYILKVEFQNLLIFSGNRFQNFKIFKHTRPLDLEVELQRLNIELERLRQENKRLRQLLELSSSYVNSIPAEIVFRIKEEITDRIVINAGKDKDVKPNSAVVTRYGLLGVVDEVHAKFSTVLPIYDPRFQVSARVSSTREVALLKGRGKGKELVLTYLDLNTQANSGDLVFTSGEGILPKGIFLGKIDKVSVHPSQIYKVAQVRPIGAIDKVEDVVIICKELE